MLITLAACAGPGPRIDANVEALAKVRSIAVIRAPEPSTYMVVNFGHPGAAFGLVGGLFAAADQNSKQDRLSEAIAASGHSVTASLAKSVADMLSRAGFETVIEDSVTDGSGGKEMIQSNADAVLVIAPRIIGFLAAGATSDYLPTVAVVATLHENGAGTHLYRGSHVAGYQPKGGEWRTSPAGATFANFDALMANPERSAQSLTEAAKAVATTIADDLIQ
ncbi:MAG TPA: hypothetical protein PLN31_20935 [Azoarcus taiwanensis]|nr:hypothetical protein [Azoarcus taiwanensis]